MRNKRTRATVRTVRAGRSLTVKFASAEKQTVLGALEAARTVRVDLSAVTEVDTAGVQVLLVAKRYADQTGKSLRLESASDALVDVLDLLRLTTHLLGTTGSSEQP